MERNFQMTVEVRMAPLHQYDQAGLMVRISAGCWIKTSVEYEDASLSRLGCVVTNRGYSDWSTQDVSAAVTDFALRVTREGGDYLVEAQLPGRSWSQLRLAHLEDDSGSAPVRCGVYACSPKVAWFHRGIPGVLPMPTVRCLRLFAAIGAAATLGAASLRCGTPRRLQTVRRELRGTSRHGAGFSVFPQSGIRCRGGGDSQDERHVQTPPNHVRRHLPEPGGNRRRDPRLLPGVRVRLPLLPRPASNGARNNSALDSRRKCSSSTMRAQSIYRGSVSGLAGAVADVAERAKVRVAEHPARRHAHRSPGSAA